MKINATIFDFIMAAEGWEKKEISKGAVNGQK